MNFTERLDSYQNIILYGAGRIARELLILIRSLDQELMKKIHVAVTNPSGSVMELEGIHVVSISDVSELQDSIVIIAAVPVLEEEMESYARKLGFHHFLPLRDIIDELYETIWRKPIEKRKILFMNHYGNGFGDNPKYIALELLKRSAEQLDLVWVLRHGLSGDDLPEGIRSVEYGTYEYLEELGTAHVWVDNITKSVFSRKREGQVYLQTWHGGGPLKKISFDAAGKHSRSDLFFTEYNAEMEDLMLSPAAVNSAIWRSALHYRGEILESGYPRNDIIRNPGKIPRRVRSALGLPEESGIVLYAPTFHKGAAAPEIDADKICSAMEERFHRRFHFLVRLHPDDRFTVIRGTKEILNVTDYPDVQELLAAADVLITDYSSVMWDFGVGRKPAFLIHPDNKGYEEERGYYRSFSEMPYIECTDNEDLAERIKIFDADSYKEEMDAFLEECGCFDRGNASAVVSDWILERVSG